MTKNILTITGFGLFVISLILSCKATNKTAQISIKDQKKAINQSLNTWHKAAGEADFKTYFGLMDDQAIFVGTDSAEVWHKQAFMNFSKPYFDKGKAWQFTPINRHIYLDNNHKNMAWFDETLDTWMGICRGSGILVYKNHQWLIKHYVLSLTVPNDKINKVIKILK